jgi:hypothetical protein
MTTQIEINQRNHHRAVRFFWCFLIGATTVSLIGNIAHTVLSYLPRIVIQIGAAAVPPIALLAAALDDLLARKPHLATRRPTGEIGQGASPLAASSVDLAALLRQRAR